MPTTIKVSDRTARQLRDIAPTYDKAISKALSPVLKTKNLPFNKTVSALEEDSQEWRIDFDAYVSQVVVHFPPGCNGLVYTRLIYIPPDSGTYYYVIPSVEGQYLYYDDSTPMFDLKHGFPVEKDGTLRVEWQNYDGAYSHTVSWSVQLVSR